MLVNVFRMQISQVFDELEELRMELGDRGSGDTLS